MARDIKIEDEPPTGKVAAELTEDEIRDALRRSAAGANALNQKLRDVFSLTAASAQLRLR